MMIRLLGYAGRLNGQDRHRHLRIVTVLLLSPLIDSQGLTSDASERTDPRPIVPLGS